MAEVFLINLPHDCSDHELQGWAASHGVDVLSTRVIRDLVAGVSPAFGYVEVQDKARLKQAVAALDGEKLRHRTVTAKPVKVTARHAAHGSSARR